MAPVETLAQPHQSLADDADDFTLDVTIVSGVPVPELMRSTSDNCGSTCSGTACTSFTSDPDEPTA